MTLDLLEELRGIELPFSALRSLIGMGVPREVALGLHASGDLAVGQVEIDRHGRFEFGGPDRRLILTVRAPRARAAGGGGGYWDSEVVDLVAMSSTCEDEWALRTGQADFLGETLIDDAIAAERRELRLFSTPMAWLRGGCAGICVLDWTAAALGALRGLGSSSAAVARGGADSRKRTPVTLVVDPGAKARLEAMLAHGGLPLVAEDRGAHAGAEARREAA